MRIKESVTNFYEKHHLRCFIVQHKEYYYNQNELVKKKQKIMYICKTFANK